MDRSEIRSLLLHDVIAVETEPFSVRVATLVSAIDRIEAALRAAERRGIEAAAKVAETTVTKTRDFGRPPYEGAPGFWGICTMTNGDQQTADKIAAAIRALLTKESDDA